MTDILKNGKNTLGIVLGNGLRNAWGGFIWDFDKAVFRGAPITAFSLELLYSDGAKETIISDSQTKTAPSPILYDDLHTGEMFDARLQIPDWGSPDYEDGNWSFALKAEAPRGELKICEAELAYNMIVRPDFSSYGNWIARGATTLWEEFYPEKGEGDLVRISSHNHHFWGDVSAWFYRYLAGINVNPQKQDANNINIEPVFIEKLDFVKASYAAKDGTVAVDWKRNGDTVVINIELTGKVYGKIILPNGFAFEDNSREKELKTAERAIKTYRELGEVFHKGDCYRLKSPFDSDVCAIEFVSEDKNTVILTVNCNRATPNAPDEYILLEGLDETAVYALDGTDKHFGGDHLMNIGWHFVNGRENQSVLAVFKRAE